MPLARIGVGANLGDAAATVRAALDALGSLGTVSARSSLYGSAPWGVRDQPAFVNAAALLETNLAPHDLLAGLKALERRFGRVPGERWGPRALDLDILAYGDVALDDPDLTIPHRRLFERGFALGPLAEIDPAFAPAFAALPPSERRSVWRIPAEPTRRRATVTWDETLGRVRSAAEFCSDAGLVRVRIEEDDLAIEVRRTPRPTRVFTVAESNDSAGEHEAHPSGNGVAHDEPPATILRAEFVGIVRFSRPTVGEGTVLGTDRELAFVESLGIRNPVRSGGPGRVARVFVSDGAAVEYGQPLFSIET